MESKMSKFNEYLEMVQLTTESSIADWDVKNYHPKRLKTITKDLQRVIDDIKANPEITSKRSKDDDYGTWESMRSIARTAGEQLHAGMKKDAPGYKETWNRIEKEWNALTKNSKLAKASTFFSNYAKRKGSGVY